MNARILNRQVRGPAHSPSMRLWISAALFALLYPAAWGNEPLFIDVEPFDRIFVTPEAGGGSFDIFSLEWENTVVPAEPKPTDILTFRLLDRPRQTFTVEFKHIATIERFPQIVRQKIDDLIAQGAVERAQVELEGLVREWPTTPGIDATIAAFLMTDAQQSFQRGDTASALAALRALAKHRPADKGVKAGITASLRRAFRAEFDKQRYAAARRILDWASQSYEDLELSQEWSEWRSLLAAEGDRLLSEARAAVDRGAFREARSACDWALAAAPGDANVRRLLAEIDRRYPVLNVGVLRRAPPKNMRIALEWSSRRVSDLDHRPVVTQVGVGSDGGRYEGNFGKLAADPVGDELEIHLERPATTGELPFTAYDLSRWLLDPHGPVAREQASDRWLREVRVTSITSLNLRLVRPLLRPERLLQFALADNQSRDDAPGQWYRREQARPANDNNMSLPEVSHVRGRDVFSRQAAGWGPEPQFQEIVEVVFDTEASMLRALQRGEIDLVDRVTSFEPQRTENDREIEVVPYGAPTLHLLVPHPRNAGPDRRTWRRALLMALDRQQLLADDVLGFNEPRRGRVLASVFPVEESPQDAWGYAGNPLVRPLPYDPALARTLFLLAQRRRGVEAGADAATPIVVACPDEPRVREICESVVAGWRGIDIPTQLQVLPAGQVIPPHETWDFLYLEVVISEPLHEIGLLLGPQGLQSEISPRLSRAISNLLFVADWAEARRELLRIHEIVRAELPILPLWQVRDVLAHRRSVTGLSSVPLRLYQQLPNWRRITDP